MRFSIRWPACCLAILTVAAQARAWEPTPNSNCAVTSDGSASVADAQLEFNEALGIAQADNDLNSDGSVNVVDIEIVIKAALGLGCAADSRPPAMTSVSPPSGKAGSTVTLTVTGQYLSGAIFTLRSLDPIGANGASSVSVDSNTEATATLTVVLGRTQGLFALIATNSNGPSVTNPAAAILIGPTSNSVSAYTSVLNMSDNTISNPPLPAGRNSVSYHAAVLNTNLNTITNPPLRAGQNTVSDYISICNTSTGCTAMAPASFSVDASPNSLRERRAPLLPRNPPAESVPVIDPLEAATTVTVGQTLRLTARNVAPGASVEFDVNQVIIATVRESPYETLFTVPDGPDELAFQVVVRSLGQSERLSQVSRMAVVSDAGASVAGSIVQGTGGLKLSLFAGGLRAEFFHLAQPVIARPDLGSVQPVRSGYVTAINQPNPHAIFGDDPLGAHLGTDYAVRFTGEVRAELPGQYRFWLTARNGAAILIDGSFLGDSGFVSGEPAGIVVSAAMDRGWHSIEVIYYLAVGASSVGLEWQQPGGRREVLGPEYLRTSLTGMTAVSAADGTFAFPEVPKKFDSVWIRAKFGSSLVEFPAVKPGANLVSLTIPE